MDLSWHDAQMNAIADEAIEDQRRLQRFIDYIEAVAMIWQGKSLRDRVEQERDFYAESVAQGITADLGWCARQRDALQALLDNNDV